MSFLSKRRLRTARFFVRSSSSEREGRRFSVRTSLRFALFPTLVCTLLVGACTILPFATIPAPEIESGEPTVAYAGEPQVAGVSPDQEASTTTALPLSPLVTVDTSLANGAPALAPSEAISFLTPIAGATPNSLEEASPLPSVAVTATAATPALESLLQMRLTPGSTRAIGGIAVAAGGPGPTATAEAIQVFGVPASGDDPREEVETGIVPQPELVPELQPVAATATLVRATPPTPVAEVTPDDVERTLQVPILMYHYLSTPPADADIYRRDLSVAPDLFGEQLDRMLAEGYTTISLYTFMQSMATGAPLPEKPVILTFDDGYRDNYLNAFPALRDRGMTATFFIVTDFIDQERPEYLTWDMAREMLAGGMSIESHGRNHASLEGRDDDYLVWQALGSLETIAFELGVRPRFVAYPAGEYDGNTQRIFASAGYWAGVTTQQGATHSSDNLFALTRVRMRGTTSPDELIRLLHLNW